MKDNLTRNIETIVRQIEQHGKRLRRLEVYNPETGNTFDDTEGNPTDVDVTAAADGTSENAARRDHRHHLGAHAASHNQGGSDALTLYNDGEGNPAAASGASSSDGTSVYSARRDHRHQVTVYASTPENVNWASGSAGVSNSIARGDHRHQLGEHYHDETDVVSTGTTVSRVLMLPLLRAYWPLSSVSISNDIVDISGQGKNLTVYGSPTYGLSNYVPYISLNGTTQYGQAAASDGGLGITGSFTIGGWFYFNSFATRMTLLSKWREANDKRSYSLEMTTSGEAHFRISNDGAGFKSVTQSIGDTETGVWRFICGRFTASTEISVWSYDVKATNSTAIPATIYNGTATFRLGARDDTTYLLNGRASLCWVCAYPLPDAFIQNLYDISSPLFA